MQRFEMYINGESCQSASGEWFELTTPITGEPWALMRGARPTDVDRAVGARTAPSRPATWPKMSPRRSAARCCGGSAT